MESAYGSDRGGSGRRFGAGTPRINDGSLLFLQHMISKMKPVEQGGSRIAIVFNGSPLFTGAAESGESNIRRWILENDWLEAIVALPEQLFYNTGISTYFWILSNRKAPALKDKVILLDGRECWSKMRKSLGDKRKLIPDDQIASLTEIYKDALTIAGELVEYLGRGGYGEVWKGFDQSLDRHVAAKFIRSDRFPTPELREEAEQRFRREARVTARIQHPGVPIIHDIGTHKGDLYLMMQLVQGYRVDHLIEHHRRLPVAWAAAIGAQICAVLTVAHAESLIHRDLKPSNLFLCPDGTVKVLDFGIVAVLGSGDITQITRAGEGLGTPFYMSPEMSLMGTASPQSDLYALGCVLHELLAGSRVFESEHTAAEVGRHLSEPPAPLRSVRADVPAEMERLVLDLLAKKPSDRPSGAAEVYERLLPFVDALPPLPGTVTAAPSPDPMRMYAAVVERIAETALARPHVPVSEPASALPTLSEAELVAANHRAEELALGGRLSQAIELLEGASRR
ncbi:protein kinase [Sphaerisporangium sp. NBC_01403]